MSLRKRTRPGLGTIEPCLPSPAKATPSGPNWIHEIKPLTPQSTLEWHPSSVQTMRPPPLCQSGFYHFPACGVADANLLSGSLRIELPHPSELSPSDYRNHKQSKRQYRNF